jgi:uncharacterized protein YcaQ
MAKLGEKTISKETARRFLLSINGFFEEKHGKKGTLEAIRQLGCIQTDPITIVHRNHHLVLHNRVVDYKLEYLEELLYKDRFVFEYWCNEKSIIPMEDFRYFRYRMQNPSEFHSPFYERIKAQRKEMERDISHALSEIRKHGALSAQEFEQSGKIRGKLATKILNLLWDCGDLMIERVEGNRRYFDLTERLLSSRADAKTISKAEYEKFMIRRYMKAYGLVDTRDWRFGWLALKGCQRKAIVDGMMDAGELCPVRVEGVKHGYYVLKEYLRLLEEDDVSTDGRVCFVAPLDNLLWNRRMISEIFDFDYSWEVYKVPEKRVYGYYVMPILYGTRFIGRLDPQLDRQNKKMIIHSLLLEEKPLDKALVRELVGAIERFLAFHDVYDVFLKKIQPNELITAVMAKLKN